MNVIPYLSFNGNCREALTFYAELLGGAVESFVPWQAEMIADIPEATVEHVMHGSITVDGTTIAGADQFGDRYAPGGNASLMLDIDDLDRAKAVFDALAEGGHAIMPFGETFWAKGYGYCADRYGILWQVNSSGGEA